MKVWWLKIIGGLAKVNPQDVLTQSNLQDLFDIMKTILGG